jgi:hypothetical protein
VGEEELTHLLERLRERRLFDEVFVLILEREPQGDWKLLDYGMREISDIAAWLAVQKQKYTNEKEKA